ncbi:MAG: biopolymer transporter ExbD [bacterium]
MNTALQKSFLSRLKPIPIGSAMADMALLLLIFFMASTSTEPPKGVEVDLPKARVQGAEQDSLYVTIGKDGSIYFDGKQVSLEEMRDLLAMRSGESDRIVSVTADKNLTYQIIFRALEVFQEQNFLNVVFMSEQRSPHRGPQ